MNAGILIWLLISLPGNEGFNSNVPTTTVAQFVDAAECERVKAVIRGQGGQSQNKLMCIQAAVRPNGKVKADAL